MPDVNFLAVLVATIVTFGLGATYYMLLGKQLADASAAGQGDQEMRPWKVAVELVRGLLVAGVVAGLAAEAGIDTVSEGFLLGVALWVGFPVVLWVGAVIHEGVPVKLAAIHAGDWLAKLVAVSLIVSAWG